MNILVGILVACACSYVGIALREQMRHRAQLLLGVQVFAASYLSNLSFLQLHLKPFVEAQSRSCTAVVKKLLDDFVAYLDRGAEETFEVNYVFLEPSDCQVISQFFTLLGKGNSVGQLQQTQQFEGILKACHEKAQQTLSGKGNLCAKLGVAVGVLAAIILL